jgi:CHAT domain-containing protein
MVRLKGIRYGVLGLLMLILCVVSRPALAHWPLSPGGSPTAATVAQASASLEQQAQIAYQQGQYQQAATLLQQAADFHQRQGNLPQVAIALSNLSLTYQHLGDWVAAERAINQARQAMYQQPLSLGMQAQMLDVQGQLYFAQGLVNEALATWRQSADLYTQTNDRERQALSRLHQSQALQAQGLYHQVLRTLEDLAADVNQQPNSPMKATILRQLGDSLRATGNLAEAQKQLEGSLQIAEDLNHTPLIAAANLSLGNLEQGKFKVNFEAQSLSSAIAHGNQALNYYKRVAQLDDGELGIQARLNFMRLITNPILARWDLATAFYPTIKALLPQLPPGRSTVLAYVGLAENLITLRSQSPQAQPDWEEIAELLAPIQAQAKALGDRRSQSLVLGTLGHLYEQTRQWDVAKDLSRQALTWAQQAQADDIRYRWEWQLGRILKAEGDETGAIAAYSRAYTTINALRSDLVTANPDVQFSFRESVEPIYRELVDLLVKPVPQLQDIAQIKASSEADQRRLRQARDVMESLQVAELENFFQAACIDNTVSIDQVVSKQDRTAAVIYAILLRDRLEVVLKLPQQEALVHFATPASSDQVQEALKAYRNHLTQGADVQGDGQQLYTWLLKPAIDQGLLSPEQIKTLIFVLDGNLRLIPMATLHDGEDFLVKKYAVSLVLGQEVRDPLPLPPRDQMHILAASLETPPTGRGPIYSTLPGATEEVATIKATGMPVTTLQDAGFTGSALNQELSETDYTIVHLATHGQFGSDRQNTYILAADGRITIDNLGQIFQSRRQADTRLEMLILSACKTATGDSREVLGIAGAMVQSGARSTIATLWSVDDQASVLFTEAFYAELAQPGISRAEALRRAQVALLERYPGRPRYWAPYVLVGSWR